MLEALERDVVSWGGSKAMLRGWHALSKPLTGAALHGRSLSTRKISVYTSPEGKQLKSRLEVGRQLGLLPSSSSAGGGSAAQGSAGGSQGSGESDFWVEW